MKKFTATLLGFLILGVGSLAQTPTKPKKNVPSVSLDTILSCGDDPYVRRVFKTDLGTMHKLSMYAMTIGHVKDKSDETSMALRYAGFQSSGTDPLVPSVAPYGPDGLMVTPPPPCTMLDAYYKKDADDSLPYMVSIYVDPDYWVFNPNEFFLHADQFTFSSGVFSNNSGVFFDFVATKRRVRIQFVPGPDGLTLHRVFIGRDTSVSN